MVSEFRFFKKKKKKKKKAANLRKSCLPVFWTSYDIFIHFLHAVIFSCVLHLDVVRSQIELKLKFPYAEQPIAIPIYTQYHHTV